MDHSFSNILADYRDFDGSLKSSVSVMASKEAAPLHSTKTAVDETHAREDLSVFFGIGMAVNVIMIVAFLLWARKEWKKHDASKK